MEDVSPRGFLLRPLTIFGGRTSQAGFDLYRECAHPYQRLEHRIMSNLLLGAFHFNFFQRILWRDNGTDRVASFASEFSNRQDPHTLND